MAEKDSLAASLLVLLSLEPKLAAVGRSAVALEVVVVVMVVVPVAVVMVTVVTVPQQEA